MTATTLNKYRPFTYDGADIWKKIKSFNYGYWFARSPMAVLSLPAAYATSAFASETLPIPFNWFAGLGIELVYLGCIAIADQLYEEDWFTTALWWVLNLIAVSMSAIINVLHAGGSKFSGIHAESFVYVALPVLAFGYSLLLQRVTNRNAAREYKAEQERIAKEKEEQQYIKDNPYLCECGMRFPDNRRRSNHRRSCESYQVSMETQ